MSLEQPFTRLLDLRWEERNRRLKRQCLEVKQRLHARGIRVSSIAVGELHKVVEEELRESVSTIVTTAIDVISNRNGLRVKKKLQALCADALKHRRDSLEGQLRSEVQPIADSLLSQSLVASHKTLDGVFPLLKEEMPIKLSQAYDAHKRQEGNVLGIIWNKILDHIVGNIVGYGILTALMLLATCVMQ